VWIKSGDPFPFPPFFLLLFFFNQDFKMGKWTGSIEGWRDTLMDGYANGWMHTWMDGWMDGNANMD
jgi:hypothetical protein